MPAGLKQKDPILEIQEFDPKTNLKLRNWFLKEKRDLPFRKNRTPYSTWVSEIMLQQTRVAAMLPLYEKFMARFPKPEDLASAEEEEVFRYWQGLGYYSRAKNLLAGVRKLVNEFRGKFPETLEEALSLPGIGPYTARAILSISYNLPFAVLDGNAKRVLSRLAMFRESGPKADPILQKIADSFLNRDFPGDHNEAVMELGARICIPKPLCTQCPLQTDCIAYQNGVQESIPETEKKKKEIPLDIRFYILKGKQGILLVRYPERRFFKTIYSLPFSFEGKNPYEPDPVLDWDLKTSDLGIKFKHTITHHKIQGFVSETELDAKKEKRILEDFRKARPSIEIKYCHWRDLETEFPSSIAKKIKQTLAKNGAVLPGLEN
ncbi:A/G-specific adenine glycosylase [Leptospira langatensis]|uniref:Adenine DNA glycosylase n=1 Tax=Leptospira langatensis TaxID=2484983 RepID=A0A5F1ZRI7_9LEPT|nr:A/G-specific adenine glycosylase [Leptospira langatensis]TGK05564.1 A/G-specific adenine glycosylase [Leptospira langatensis]TGL38696.1 A/G-specific adenine glycosylase [Leptospira langatensis]